MPGKVSLVGGFSLSLLYLNILFHSLMAGRVSAEKSGDSLMEAPLYEPVAFLLQLLIFSLIFAILIAVYLGVILFGWSCLGLSVLSGPGYLFLSQVTEVFSYYIYKYTPFSLLLQGPL